MTKDAYFEMCEMLGQEPLESETPVDINDFPIMIQQMLVIYSMLEDRWDTMGGGYLGKNYSNIFDFFKLYEVDSSESLLMLEFLQHIDAVRSKIVAEKIKAKSPATK
jgi:hypothetical protein